MIGRFLGDPRRRAADLFLSLQDVLPNSYPLAQASIETVLADENYFARIMDYGIIAPRIAPLYRAYCARWSDGRPARTRGGLGLECKLPFHARAVPLSPRQTPRRPCDQAERSRTNHTPTAGSSVSLR
jgi:hypothetical protein